MPLSKEDTQRALSILESILGQLKPSELQATPPDQDNGHIRDSSGDLVSPAGPFTESDDLEALHNLQSIVEVMRSPLFTAIVDLKSTQPQQELAEGRSNGSLHATTDTHNGTLSNGAVAHETTPTDSTHLEYAQYDCNGFSPFEQRSTFVSHDHELSDEALMTLANAAMQSTTPTQRGKPKKVSQKKGVSEGFKRSPFGRGKSEGRAKSEKKISLGWRRGGGKSKSHGSVTLANLAQSVPRMTSSERGSPGMGGGSMKNGSLEHVDWVSHHSGEVELYDATPESRKSYDQEEEEESSLSELSALIDSASLQSEPLITDVDHHPFPIATVSQPAVAMETPSDIQATVIANDHALGQEAVEPKGEEHVSMATSGENTADRNLRTVSENEKVEPVASATTTGSCDDAANSIRTCEEEGDDIMAGPKDVLFFMRDEQSKRQIREAVESRHVRSLRTISLEVSDVDLSSGGGASIGVEMVGLSSTGVFVGGVCDGSKAGGKVQIGDQILEINGRTVENMAAFEVDMILSEISVGETAQLTVQYNPSGFADYQRLQRKRH